MAIVEAPIRAWIHIGSPGWAVVVVRPLTPAIVPQRAPDLRAASRTTVTQATIRAGIVSILNKELGLLVTCRP